jgi:hypothetical protein
VGLSLVSIVLGISLALIPDALVTSGLVLPVRMYWPVTVRLVRHATSADCIRQLPCCALLSIPPATCGHALTFTPLYVQEYYYHGIGMAEPVVSHVQHVKATAWMALGGVNRKVHCKNKWLPEMVGMAILTLGSRQEAVNQADDNCAAALQAVSQPAP